MSRFRSLTRPLAVGCLVLFLAACGTSGRGPAGTDSAGGSAVEPVKVGVVLSLSGPAAPQGDKERIGVEMAAAEINASGGIMGRPVELIIRDDAGDPTKARTAAEELVEKEKVAFIIGPTLSSPAMAIHPYLTEQKIVNLGSPAAAAATDPNNFPYAFATSPNDLFIGKTIVDYAVGTLHLHKLAVMSESTAFGKGGLDALTQIFAEYGIEPVAVEEYTVGSIDYTTQLRRLQAAGAEGIIVTAGNSTDVVRIVKNLQSMGWDVPLFGNANLADFAVIEGVGRDGLKKVYSQNHRPLTYSADVPLSDKVLEFREKVRERYDGQKPLNISIHLVAAFYDGLFVLKQAAEKAGSFDADAMKAALESMEEYQGVYATWTFSPTKHSALSDDDGTMVIAATCEDAVCEKAPNAP